MSRFEGVGERTIVLTGFMGTGKSAVGQLLARRLGRAFLDTDQEIEKRAGKSVADIFAQDGESAFRQAEAKLCDELSQKTNLVISTGGGTLLARKNLSLFAQTTSVFCLNAAPEIILGRLRNHNGRPLLPARDVDRLQTIHELLEDRKTAYRRIFHQIGTDEKSTETLVSQILELTELDVHFGHKNTLFVKTSDGPYPVVIAKDLRKDIGKAMHWLHYNPTHVAVVTNKKVWEATGVEIEKGLAAAGFATKLCIIADGERYKTLVSVAKIYEQFLAHGITRNCPMISVGGGVTSDIAGFAAATFLRGIDHIQIPTTLLSMVDASIGGKNGVDLPEGKNLVGTFKQPRAVFIDPNALETLPQREINCGIAEAIKHGIIGDPKLFEMFEKKQNQDLSEMIYRAVLVKAHIVEEDPLELGKRAKLNLGHTFGHAIELVSNYKIPHGEAVALGLIAASELALNLGQCSPGLPARLRAVLKQYGLPTQMERVSAEAIFNAMGHDKKRVGKNLRFVIPKAIGEVTMIEAPSMATVLQAISSIASPQEAN